MSRYNTNNGSTGGNNGDYDDKTLKLKEYAALRLTPTELKSHTHSDFGTSLIQSYEDAEVIDGIVLARADKPDTWNIYSADKFFNLNPEDGLVYESYDEEEDTYSGEMSAQDILEHPRVAGHSTSGGGNDYYFNPVGVVIEAAGDIALADDADVEATDEPAIEVGDASMLTSNNTWIRTYAKKMSEMGDAIINDNGEDPTPRDEPDDNPKYSSHEWLATDDPELRTELQGRPIELWITREQIEDNSYQTPNVEDVKTGNPVTINNGVEDGDAESEKSAATDGGTMTQGGSDTTDTDTTESPDEPQAESAGLPDGVPDHLNDLLDYCGRNGNDSPEEIRDFAENQVDDPDEIDWEAASEAAKERAE